MQISKGSDFFLDLGGCLACAKLAPAFAFSDYVYEVIRQGLHPFVLIPPSLLDLTGAIQSLEGTSPRKWLAPAGVVHLCFSFGPLMIEVGFPSMFFT